MAERGAHMTAVSYARPSIFELLAQESLASTIHPSCHQLTQYLAARNPVRFGWLSNWFQEVYLCLHLIVQYHYLRKHGASFSENFYGLVRVPVNSEKLTGRHLGKSLLTLVILKYLKVKLDQWVTERKSADNGPIESEEWRSRMEKVIIQSHGLLHAGWESVRLVQILTYMAGLSPTHSPLLSLSNLTLTNSSADSEIEWHWKSIWKSGLFPKMRLPVLALSMVGNILSHSLEMGAFFLQFLNWWNIEGGKASLTESSRIPEPPQSPEANGEREHFDGKCPLCLGPRRIETVLPVSGYVFCFRCIFSYVREHGCCPITKYPTSLDELIRVHGNED